jgi:hypothetical protein
MGPRAVAELVATMSFVSQWLLPMVILRGYDIYIIAPGHSGQLWWVQDVMRGVLASGMLALMC